MFADFIIPSLKSLNQTLSSIYALASPALRDTESIMLLLTQAHPLMHLNSLLSSSEMHNTKRDFSLGGTEFFYRYAIGAHLFADARMGAGDAYLRKAFASQTSGKKYIYRERTKQGGVPQGPRASVPLASCPLQQQRDGHQNNNCKHCARSFIIEDAARSSRW
jgi:hypothetical protein